MSEWPRAVLFDFDGVIVNSEPLHFHAFHEVLREENIELTEAEYYAELLGFDDRGGFKYIFEKRGVPLPPATFLRVMTRKSQVMRRLIEQRKFSALPGVPLFIRGLWRHYPLAICSGALREEIETMLEGINLRDCFRVIVAAEDVTVGKPDPSGYLQTVRLISEQTGKRLTPADCLIVEDSPKVVSSVRQAGFKVLAVTTSDSADKLPDANWVVPSLDPEVVRKQLPSLKMMID